jgi:hypothetical protein
MDAQDFKAQWREWYGDTPPVGSHLRACCPDAWLRIHSLPGSKRYPRTAAERAELLARHNAVAGAVLGPGSACLLVTPRFGDHGKQLPHRFSELAPDENPTRRQALLSYELTLLGPVDDSWPGAQALRDDYEGVQGWLYAAPLVWHSGAHDALLQAVGADDGYELLIVSLARGNVYAPYDGGADLFFQTPAQLNFARTRYRAWLSPFEHGL